MNAPDQGTKGGTSMPESLSTKLNRITHTAKEHKSYVFRTLAHLINTELLAESFGRLRKEAAAGVDEVSARQYQADLQGHVQDLHRRLREGRYRAQALRRVYIEKEDGKQRALSIPVLEEKVVQKATTEILGRIYEQDFLNCSYGYRPNRSAHGALNALRDQIVTGRVSYVLEADIRDYFGSVVRSELKTMLQKRIADQAILRLIGKWLHVGVIEDGRLLTSENGTYQGSVISPLLANVYLHEVLDVWVEEQVKPRMRGDIALYRFADDFVVCFQYRDDAERFQDVLPKRFAKYGLTLHPKKTRLLAFGRFAEAQAQKTGRRKPETFNFLGFTFYCGKTRSGKFTVKWKTMSKRIRRSLWQLTAWCRENRHLSVRVQQIHLSAVLRGHYQYYGMRLNSRCLQQVYRRTCYVWRKWLGKRKRGHAMPWVTFEAILKRYPLPHPRITESRKIDQLWLHGEFV